MFSNLNWYNVLILLLLALFIFGDKLPQMIVDGLRMLRNLRRMAQNATSDLSRELGTDIQLEDLHPKTFVRKHLLSEADQEALLKPLKRVSDDVMQQGRGLEQDLKEVGRRAESAAGEVRDAADVRGATRRRGRGRSMARAPEGAVAAAAGGPTAVGSTPVDELPAAATDAVPAPRVRYDDII
jgi:sec-independent protein translocase protein TatB